MATMKPIHLVEIGWLIPFSLRHRLGDEQETKRRGGKEFYFDAVLDQSSSQQEMYDRCVAPLVEACLSGYNATILAYGQTVSFSEYPSLSQG